MKWPRVPIAGLMLAIAIIAFDLAVLGSVVEGRPLLGLEGLEIGAIPGVTALGIGLARILLRRRRPGPFAAGFQVAGWAAVVAYLAACRLAPDFMQIPYAYYVNNIEVYYFSHDFFDTQEGYALTLVIAGFVWGTPQLLLALAGGGLSALAARRLPLPERRPVG
jgi:hypothetical protein